jgi:hypothetical protein
VFIWMYTDGNCMRARRYIWCTSNKQDPQTNTHSPTHTRYKWKQINKQIHTKIHTQIHTHIHRIQSWSYMPAHFSNARASSYEVSPPTFRVPLTDNAINYHTYIQRRRNPGNLSPGLNFHTATQNQLLKESQPHTY